LAKKALSAQSPGELFCPFGPDYLEVHNYPYVYKICYFQCLKLTFSISILGPWINIQLDK
jgi:hypothetical protein